MKRVNNIYNNICDFDNIIEYTKIVYSKTKNKSKIERFDEYYSENIYKIKDELSSKYYTPGKYNIFLIKEPKVRLIMSQNIKDKIINHLVANYFLVNVFDKSFIDTNIATRKGYGTHLGIKLTKKYINKLRNTYGNNFYYLKFDISKFFYNIDHDIVKELLKRKIKDKDVLNILFKIIDSTDYKYINDSIVKIKELEIKRINKLNISLKEKNIKIKEIESIPLYNKGKGFPIGNMTSQIIAILYLNELDHFIKEQLHINYYIRYMDDGVLFSNDKKYLKECLNKIINILSKYKLKLNLNKTYISSISNGLDFLGFRFNIVNNKLILKLRNDCKKRFKRRIKILNNNFLKDNINYKEYLNSLASYKGHLSWGNCTKMYNNYFLLLN